MIGIINADRSVNFHPTLRNRLLISPHIGMSCDMVNWSALFHIHCRGFTNVYLERIIADRLKTLKNLFDEDNELLEQYARLLGKSEMVSNLITGYKTSTKRVKYQK
jgi:hypothetical protein